MDLVVASLKTPVGEFYMIINGKTVIKSGFGETPKYKVAGNHRYTGLVSQYFAGDKKALDKIPHRQSASPFIAKTWHAISAIPFGKTLTYAELARKAGNQKAVRATGTACGKNNIPLIVPCHRVVKSDGTIGEYAYGTKIKQFLLEHERTS